MNEENQTNEPNPTEQGGSADNATMSAVVASLKAQIADRDKRIKEAEDRVKDRDNTIRLLLDGEEQQASLHTEADNLSNFRKLCKF